MGTEIAQNESHLADAETLVYRRLGTRVDKRIVRDIFPVNLHRGWLAGRVLVGIIGSVIMVIPDVGQRDLAVERQLGGGSESLVKRIAKTRRVVCVDVPVVEISDIEEKQRVGLGNVVEHRMARSRVGAGLKAKVKLPGAAGKVRKVPRLSRSRLPLVSTA